MDKGKKSKNVCLIQYAHSIQFKKRLATQPKFELTGRKVVAKNLQNFSNNKENEKLISPNKTQKINTSQFNSSRSPSLQRNKSLEELIENIKFKNRNIGQVIRIREEEISDLLIKQKTELFNKVSQERSEIDVLEVKKNECLKKQNQLLYEGVGKVINDNAVLSENIAYLKESISHLKSSAIEYKVHYPSRQRIHTLEHQESQSFKTGQDLKNKLKILTMSNEVSDPVQIYLKQRQELLEILNSISVLKLIILRILDNIPIKASKLEEIEEGYEDKSIIYIVSKIYEKCNSLRMLVSDKFAEKYTEGCKTM